MNKKYTPQEIEEAWQKRWEQEKLYQVEEDPAKPKYYLL